MTFNYVNSVLLFLMFCCMSCADQQSSNPSSNEVNEGLESNIYKVDPAISSVSWECGTAGAKIYSHYGTLAILEGLVNTANDKISGGVFSIDMTTINPQDSNYSEEHPASGLIGHLSSPDFFDVANFPIANFKIVETKGDNLIGEMNVKGVTQKETINLKHFVLNPDGTFRATGDLVFDRQKYNVSWNPIKDVIISDEIALHIEIAGRQI